MEQLSVKGKHRSKKKFQLNLSTKGHCLLCLKRPATTLSKFSKSYLEGSETEEDEADIREVKEWIRSASLSNSLQNLCKYLKVNVVKLVKENIQIPGMAGTMGTGSSKEKAKMINVFLCEKCEAVTESFSSLFQNLERIQMEMDHCLEVIRECITEAEGDPDLAEAYQESMSTDFQSMIMVGLIGEMKKEISNKCSEMRFFRQTSQVRLNMVSPNLVLPKTPSSTKFENEKCSSPSSKPSKKKVRFSLDDDAQQDNQNSGGEEAVRDSNSKNDEDEDSDSDSSLFSMVQENKANDTLNQKAAAAASSSSPMPEPIEEDEDSENDNEDKTTVVSFKCREPSCQKSFPCRASKYQHFQREHLKNIKIRKQRQTSAKLGRRQPRRNTGSSPATGNGSMDKINGKYKCPHLNCRKSYFSKIASQVHYRAEHTNQRFTCQKCGKDDFRYLASLMYHQKNHCTGKRQNHEPEQQQQQKQQQIIEKMGALTVSNPQCDINPITPSPSPTKTEVIITEAVVEEAPSNNQVQMDDNRAQSMPQQQHEPNLVEAEPEVVVQDNITNSDINTIPIITLTSSPQKTEIIITAAPVEVVEEVTSSSVTPNDDEEDDGGKENSTKEDSSIIFFPSLEDDINSSTVYVESRKIEIQNQQQTEAHQQQNKDLEDEGTDSAVAVSKSALSQENATFKNKIDEDEDEIISQIIKPSSTPTPTALPKEAVTNSRRSSFGRQIRLTAKAKANLNLGTAADLMSDSRKDALGSNDEKQDKSISEGDLPTKRNKKSAASVPFESDKMYPFDQESGMFRCRMASCSEKFNTRGTVYRHCKQFHPSLIKKRSDPKRKQKIRSKFRRTLQNKYLLDKATGKYKCPDENCGNQYTTRVAAHDHYKAEHRNLRKNSGPKRLLETKKAAYNHHRRNIHIRQIKLRQSRKSPQKQINLLEKKCGLLDERTGKYKCYDQKCSSQFKNKWSADAHYQSRHLKIRYKCENCEASFSQAQNLPRHRKICKGAIAKQKSQQQQEKNKIPNDDDKNLAKHSAGEGETSNSLQEEQNKPIDPEVDEEKESAGGLPAGAMPTE